jgi:hypothetical protein
MLYGGSMTPAEKNLLFVLGKQRAAELQMAVTMVDQELKNPALPGDQKGFLFMQRSQIGASAEEVQRALAAVQQEGQLVIGK